VLPSVLHCPIVFIAESRIYITDYRCESIIRRIRHPYFGCRMPNSSGEAISI